MAARCYSGLMGHSSSWLGLTLLRYHSSSCSLLPCGHRQTSRRPSSVSWMPSELPVLSSHNTSRPLFHSYRPAEEPHLSHVWVQGCTFSICKVSRCSWMGRTRHFFWESSPPGGTKAGRVQWGHWDPEDDLDSQREATFLVGDKIREKLDSKQKKQLRRRRGITGFEHQRILFFLQRQINTHLQRKAIEEMQF